MKPGVLFTWPAYRHPDHEAIVFQETRITYDQVNCNINRLANSLISIGLSKGQKVAVLMNNCVELVECLLGVPRAGLIVILLNARQSAKEHLEIMNDCEVDCLILSSSFETIIEPIISLIPSLKHIIVAGNKYKGQPNTSYSELVSGHPTTEPSVEVMPDEVLRLQYTSGTTGKPKGTIYSFEMIYNWMTNMIINLDQPIYPWDVNLNVGPLTHAAGNNFMLYFIKGAKNIILERFDEERVLWTIQKEKVTSMLLVPTMITRLLSHPKLFSYDLSSLRRIWYGTAPISADKLEEAISAFGPIFRQNYGMTECPQPITFLSPEEHVIRGTEEQRRRLASAGRPALGVEIKLVDQDGQVVSKDEIGEVAIRTNKIASGYWKKEELTAAAFRNGWFFAQDMARMDSAGYIYIVDRKADMIISGGFNIYPHEVEKILLEHEAVEETAVIGVPDELWGESVKALVVIREGFTISEQELIEFCRNNMTSYKKPKTVEFVTSLPRNTYGKINRRALREPYWKGRDRRV